MSTTEDESRLIRIVVDVRNVNILIKYWTTVKTEALKAKMLTEASLAQTYIETLQRSRAQHGLERLEEVGIVGEDKTLRKARPDPTNAQPEGYE